MVEHWYDYLPTCWLLPEDRWYVIGSIALLMLLAFAVGICVGRKRKIPSHKLRYIVFNK